MTTVTEGGTKVSLPRTYGLAVVLTLGIWGLVLWEMGVEGLWLAVVLTGLEITFSFDNAVVNSRLVRKLNPFWRMLFLTVGILVAVFAVRFILPIVIVMATAKLGFFETMTLAVNDPEHYAEHLHTAGPMISAFGGTFLLMIGLAYFIDAEKETHWLGWLERRLAPIGRYDNVAILVMVVMALVLTATVPGELKLSVLVASIAGIALHVALDLFEQGTNSDEDEDASAADSANGVKLAGAAAFVVFLKLEVLDASFSFDGVIGAFAISTSVVIIAAGLGTGALWVRSMTIHMVEADTLNKYKFLEHGAMWAILFLGGTMIAKLYHVELPEWITGSLGLVFIVAAIVTSIRRKPIQDETGASAAPVSSAV